MTFFIRTNSERIRVSARRGNIPLLLTGAVVCLPLVSLNAATDDRCRAQAKTPNFVLIIADDCTKYDTQLYGGQAATPNMMRFAAEGMTFSRCYQSAPVCSPTRHALMTAKGPVKTGAYPNHTFVKPGITCWSNWLTAAGYRAALSGKTHVNPPSVFDYEHLMTPKAVSEGHDPDFGAVDDFLADCVRKNQNFGLYICSTQPHAPWNKGDPSKYPPDKLQLPPNFVDTPETREAYSRYLAEITYFDGQVGRALDLLDKHGLAGDTMVVVLTEQGSAFPFAKWTCYDAGVTSGMVVRWPGHVNPGGTSDALVEYIDIMPTFCEAAKIRTPGDLDGRSFLGLLKGATGRHKDYAFSLATSRGLNNGPECYGVRSVRGARHRYILNLSPGETFVNWTTLQPWYEQWREKAAAGDKHAAGMVKRYQHRPAEELYDVEKDPWCLDNIMGDPSLKDELATLRRQLAAWMKDQGDKGQATEMAAKDRLWKNARENPGRKN